jgi:hypothetical protein
VVQFRGDGAVALRTDAPLVRVKLPPAGVVFVDATRLAGWIGRVIPRAVVPPAGSPMGDVCVECTGEGVVLVDATVGTPAVQIVAPEKAADKADKEGERSGRPSRPPPPPPGEATLDLDVVKAADWLSDDAPAGTEPGRDEI